MLNSPVAVVSTRNPTDLARKATRRIAQLLAKRRHTMVTGLAKGIDREVAEAVTKTGGAVVGVPPHLTEPHLAVLEQDATWLLNLTDSAVIIAEHLTEDPGWTRQCLAARNRIIAGMSHDIIIPETRYKPKYGDKIPSTIRHKD